MYFELEPLPVWTWIEGDAKNRVDLDWYLNTKSSDNLPQILVHFIKPESPNCVCWLLCWRCDICCCKLGCIFNVTRWMWQLWYLWIHCRTEQQLMGNAFIQIVRKTCWLCPLRRADRLHTNTFMLRPHSHCYPTLSQSLILLLVYRSVL